MSPSAYNVLWHFCYGNPLQKYSPSTVISIRTATATLDTMCSSSFSNHTFFQTFSSEAKPLYLVIFIDALIFQNASYWHIVHSQHLQKYYYRRKEYIWCSSPFSQVKLWFFFNLCQPFFCPVFYYVSSQHILSTIVSVWQILVCIVPFMFSLHFPCKHGLTDQVFVPHIFILLSLLL